MHSEPPETPIETKRSREAMRSVLERQLAGETPDPDAVTRPVVADHELIQRIGRGAYGEIWLARNALGTLRAVKVIYRERFAEERPYEREFHGILKYEPVSRTHAGLVQVLHVGRNDETGFFYYIMELADDASAASEDSRPRSQPPDSDTATAESSNSYHPRTLRSELADVRRFSPPDAAQLTLGLLNALGHLHAHGLVHRDIKPGNVIFVGGQPKLADIGLVTDAGGSRSFVGTEGFVAPEGPGTPQADLYSLGKLLYELATGRDRMDFPQLPPDLAQWHEGEALFELNEVMSRACAPDAAERYTSAKEFQADLNLFLAGRSLRRARNVERSLAQLKRFAGAASVLVIAGAAALWLANREARNARERAGVEFTLRQRAEAAEREWQRQLHSALFEQARAAVRSGEAGQRIHAIDALKRAAAIFPMVDLRREVIAALALPDLRLDREIPLEEGITHPTLDPKFERVAVARRDGAVEVRTIPEQRVLATFPAADPDPITHAKWSPDGRFLAFRRGAFRSGADRLTQVEVWEVAPGRRVLALPRTPWSAFAFHPSLPRIVSGDTNDAISTWNLETGEMLTRFALEGLVHHLEFTSDGARIFAQHRVGWPWQASVLDAVSGVVQRSELSAWSDGVALHPRDSQIAFAMRTGEVVLGDAIGSAHTVLGRHKSEARSVAFTADGRFLFTGGEEREIICWNLRTGRRAFSFAAGAMRVQLAADGERCAIVADTRVLLYHLERATLHREFSEHLGGNLRHAAFSPDGRWLAVGGQEQLGLWDLSSESPALLLEGEFLTPVFSPESTELLVFGGRYHARGRIVPAGQASDPPGLTPLAALRPNRILSAHFVTDSLVLGTDDGVNIVPRTDVSAEGSWHRLIGQVSGQVSPNGRWLAWRTSKSLLISSLVPWKSTEPILFESALATAFTPQSDELLVATRSGMTFFETVSWKPRRTFSAAFDRNARLLPSPDGRTFWLAQDAQTAALHDLRTLEPVLPLPRGMIPLALSLDGRRVAVSVDAQRVQVWDVPALRQALGEMGLDWRDPPD